MTRELCNVIRLSFTALLSLAVACGAASMTAAASAGDTCGISVTTSAPATVADVAALRVSPTADSQYLLALAYAVGTVVPHDCREAATLMAKAAEAHIGAAETGLGEMYAAGRGVPSSDAEATRWFSAANDARDAHGAYELGLFIAQGRAKGDVVVSSHQAGNQSFSSSDVLHSRSGAGPNWSVVATLWQRSADLGDARAAYDLGQLYESGQGVPVDVERAVALYRTAAAGGITAAQTRLSELGRQ